MFILRRLKTHKIDIYQRKNNKTCVQNGVRSLSETNYGENDKDQLLRLFEEDAKNFQMTSGKVFSLDKISPYHWHEITQLKTKSARRKYLEYLWLTETRKDSKRMKQSKRRLENEQDHLLVDTSSESRLFLYRHFPDAMINRFLNNNLARAMLFRQTLIIDCSYDDKMIQRETAATAEQLKRLFATNREQPDPFDIHFCHARPSGKVITNLAHRIPTLFNPEFPINLYEGSYLDKFAKKSLVYLTPDSDDELLEFSHDDIYIIGAVVDRVKSSPYSLLKAKQERLRTAKLPLGKYLTWISGGQAQALAINQVVSILLDLKSSLDWRCALERNVPRRKLAQNEDEGGKDNLKNFKESRFSDEIWGGQKLKKGIERDLRKRYTNKARPKMTINCPGLVKSYEK